MNVFLDDQCILQEGHLLASSKLWHITGNVTSTTPDPSSMHAPINLTVSAIGGHTPNPMLVTILLPLPMPPLYPTQHYLHWLEKALANGFLVKA